MTPEETALRIEDLEHLRSGLHLMALRALGTKPAAEEIAQETLARAVVALQNGHPVDPVRVPAFVAGIARHVIADALRAGRRVVSLDAQDQSQPVAIEADALDALVSAAERERVQAALRQLSPADHELLRLCYFDGLTPTEVAARLGEPAERIRKRKSRALERLRTAFRGGDPAGGHESGPGTT